MSIADTLRDAEERAVIAELSRACPGLADPVARVRWLEECRLESLRMLRRVLTREPLPLRSDQIHAFIKEYGNDAR